MDSRFRGNDSDNSSREDAMKYNYHIVVIGGGSAGLVTAAGGASLGARVALIEAEKMGGDCLNTGCVPSKTFLRSAHLAAEIREAGAYGLSASLAGVNAAKLMKRVADVIGAIAPHDSVERFTGLGVDVISGKGILLDNHSVKVNGRTITGKYIVIATGSRPAVPPIPGLAGAPYYTNENIFGLRKLPKKLIVLGGGPIGLELGQGFCHLGSGVEIIDMAPRLFQKDDPEVAPLMEKIFRDEGIILTLSANIKEVKKSGSGITVVIEKNGAVRNVTGSHLLVSLGRKPATESMGLEQAGVKVNERGYVAVNGCLQTSVNNIYACGDVAGPFQFTHMAGYQAGVVLRNIIFPLKKARVDYSAVPWTTYTRPEAAHAGYTEPMAKEKGLFADSIIADLGENDRARAENDTRGFLKLVLGKKGLIIGATLVGNRAGDIIPLASMAIRGGMKATAFMSQIFPYPTEAEIFKTASIAAAKKSFKPWMKAIIKGMLLR
jgi:pyruvate/2-oxoglutarate dehydrogenase complex dihydrolipoamide dehydrogenase (E3) component